MQSIHRIPRTRLRRRAGLAPLELVLSLPIMLFVMALIIDFGNMAPWKTRATNVAREAAWREHWPHQGGNNPLPASWPANSGQQPTAQRPYKDASLGRQAAQPLVLATDPFSAHSVVRGPFVVSTLASPVNVDRTKVDFQSGLVEGTSHIELRLPLLPKLPHIIYDLRHPLLDYHFTYGEMGYASNDSRRVLLLYSVGLDTGLLQQYTQALMRVYQLWAVQSPTELSPGSPGVMTLDRRDDEFIKYQGQAPEFHPSFRAKRDSDPDCETDREAVRMALMIGPGGLVDRIQGPRGGGKGGVPDSMASAFIALYQAEIERLKAMDPPPVGQIAALQKKIDDLQKFKDSLK